MAGYDKIEQVLELKVTGGSDIDILNKQIQALSQSQKKLRKENKQGTTQFAEQDVQLKALRSQYNKAAKDVARLATEQKKANVEQKKAGSFTQKMAASMTKATLAVGGAVAVFRGLTRAAKYVIDTLKGFEFQMAKVRAVTGASESQIKKLEVSALRLGRSTFFTARQVAEMQLNLSKLGFTANEILNAQEAVLKLSTAIGEDLGRTATVVAASIRGFGEDTIETARFADVMAKAFTSSALDLEKFQTSMTKVSSIAALAGFSFEETTALLGTLTDAGIEASIAGTSLRNILLHLQDPTSELSKRLGGTVNSGAELIEALKQLQAEGINVAGVMGIVQKRQVQAMSNFIDSADAVDEFTDALNNAIGSVDEMEDIMSGTLQGALTETKSAWEGFILALETGDSTISKFFTHQTKKLTFFLNDLALSMTNSSQLGLEGLATNVKAAQKAYRKYQADAIKEANKGNEVQAKTYLDFLREQRVKVKKALLKLEDEGGSKKRIEAYKVTLKELGLVIGEQFEKDADARKKQAELLANAKAEATNLINLKEEEIAQAELMSASTKKELREKNSLLESLRAELVVLKELGTEKEEQRKAAEAERLQKEEDAFFSQALKDKEATIEDLIGEKKLAALLAFNAIENKTQQDSEDLKKTMFELEMERLIMLGDARAELGLSTTEIDVKVQAMKSQLAQQELSDAEKLRKEKEAAAKASIDNANKIGQSLIKIGEAEGENSKVAKAGVAITKAASIASAVQGIIDAQRAITKQASEGDPYSAFARMAMMAAAVAPLIASLMSLKGGKFAQGGLTEGGMFQGPSHANGGVKFSAGGRIHEAEGGEAIINKRSTAQFKPILSAINSYNGYGKKFALGGITDGIHSKYALGGLTSSSIGDIVSGGMAAQTVMVVESDITTTQGRVSAIEAQASF